MTKENREVRLRTMLLALAVACLASGAAPSPQETEVLVPVRQFIYAVNKGDTQGALAVCADEMSIIDEIAPYEWHGPGACSRWLADFGAYAQQNAMTEIVVTLGAPRHVDVDGENAYVVTPADLNYKLNGKPTKQVGSTFTVTLKKMEAAWRITGWAWAKK